MSIDIDVTHWQLNLTVNNHKTEPKLKFSGENFCIATSVDG